MRRNCHATALCTQNMKLKGTGGEVFDYQLMRLPFSDDGTQVSHILTAGLYDENVIGKAFEL